MPTAIYLTTSQHSSQLAETSKLNLSTYQSWEIRPLSSQAAAHWADDTTGPWHAPSSPVVNIHEVRCGRVAVNATPRPRTAVRCTCTRRG